LASHKTETFVEQYNFFVLIKNGVQCTCSCVVFNDTSSRSEA